ncbi:MAG TPA: hypothetical protein VFS23_41855 [Vicinamibacterales bacterium]|nr:hypothetical protein [Vicinamibacterales bacterium]
MKLLTGVGVVAVCAVALIEAQAGQVSGTFTVNGKPVKLTNISAVTYDTASQGRMVSVLASDKPADPKTFQEYTRIGAGEKYVPGMITGAWVTMHADDKAFSGFQFTFNSEQKLILNDVMVGTRDQNFGIVDDYLVLELKSVTPRLVGRIRTKDPVVDLGSQKVGIDLTFDAAVSEVK